MSTFCVYDFKSFLAEAKIGLVWFNSIVLLKFVKEELFLVIILKILKSVTFAIKSNKSNVLHW